MGADFDRIAVQHPCPRCNNAMPEYQTGQLGGKMRVYRLGERIYAVNQSDFRRLEDIPDFEFHLYDVCGLCLITIEGDGIVRGNKLWSIIEKGYRDERASPIIDYDHPMEVPERYTIETVLIGEKPAKVRVPVGKKIVYPQEQPFIPNERVIATLE
ncbi:MAG: hypothetical protein HYW26_04105 [Candidatus Aenigmarchaeota archaeon]|nr:hypothetical protein [Candidatus Aenigmarchaeota archaeon]